MMIDYTKILIIRADILRLEKLSQLDFVNQVSEKTGLLANKKVAEYHHCKITIYDSGTVLFTGSIHKMYNSIKGIIAPNYSSQKNYKGYNGNQFTLTQIFEVRNHLCELFDCRPHQMKFQNIEFGINTIIDFDPQLFILGLLYHRGKPFEFRYNRSYAEVNHTRYRIKIYNKSEQYRIDEWTLRIELSHNKQEDFDITGIKTFEDVNKNNLEKALNHILKRFDEVVYYDRTIDKKKLNKVAKKNAVKYSNANYFLCDLKPNKRDKHKKALKRLITNHSQNLYLKIREDLIKRGVTINRLLESRKGVIINSSSIGLNISQKINRKCAVTGIDLSHEKGNPNYIRTVTLKHLKKYDKEKFELLALTFIPKTGKSPKYENNMISQICKNVRNAYYNPRKYKQSGYRAKRFQNQLKLGL